MATRNIFDQFHALLLHDNNCGKELLVLENQLVGAATRVEYQMLPGDYRVVVDTTSGLTQPLDPPIAESPMNPLPAPEDYPLAGVPLDLCLPSMGEAAGKFYGIEAFKADGTHTIDVLDKGTGSTLLTLDADGEKVLLYCTGYALEQVTTSNLI